MFAKCINFLWFLSYLFVLVLAKAIHSFARIGIELYVEADARSGLSLRTVNMTKSAFAAIVFNLDFFSSFVVKSKNPEENQCKLSMKSCLGVFRNMKQVRCPPISFDFFFIVNEVIVVIRSLQSFSFFTRWSRAQLHWMQIPVK